MEAPLGCILQNPDEDYIGDELMPEDLILTGADQLSDDDFDKLILGAMAIPQLAQYEYLQLTV